MSERRTVEHGIHLHVQRMTGRVNVMLLVDGTYYEGCLANWPMALMLIAQYEDRPYVSIFIR